MPSLLYMLKLTSTCPYWSTHSC